jgi:hypothetical protein
MRKPLRLKLRSVVPERIIMTNREREALFAKGRKLFDLCTADRDYDCVLGYLQHNLAQGGGREETAKRFIEWLREQSQGEGTAQQHAAAIIQKLEQLRE